jgi:hypothetical protein
MAPARFRCAAGVISLIGGFGGPLPRYQDSILIENRTIARLERVPLISTHKFDRHCTSFSFDGKSLKLGDPIKLKSGPAGMRTAQ